MRKAAFALCLSTALIASCKSSAPGRDANREGQSPTQPTAANEQGQMELAPVAGGGEQDTSDPLGRAWEQLSLEEQKQVFLIEQHIERAAEFRDRLELEQASTELARALELDPDNLRVKELLAEVGALMGEPGSQAGSVANQLEDIYTVRIAQLREWFAESFPC